MLAATGSQRGRSAILLIDGHGRFSELSGALPDKPFSAEAEGLAISPVELNGDGHVDLLMAYSHGDPANY